jgi:type I restriction enzyme, S subunit
MIKAWQPTKLGEVLKPNTRSETLIADKEYKLLGVRLDGNGAFHRETKKGMDIGAKSLNKVQAGDFIYSRLFAWRGAFGVIDESLSGGYVSNEFPTFTYDQTRLDNHFLKYWFLLPDVLRQVEADCTGSTPLTRNRYKEHFFLNLEVPLPSLAEQQRIVGRIEALAGKVEEARRLRETAVIESSRLVVSLLRTIFDEANWPEVPLAELLDEDTRNGIGRKPLDEPTGVPILRISAGTSRSDAIVDETDHKYITVTKKELEAYTLKKGDLLACRFNGNLHYVGRFSLYQGFSNKVQVYPDKLIRFRVNRVKALPEYVRIAANSPQVRKVIEGFCATTAGNLGISASKLKTVAIPVPSLNEQKAVVDLVERLQAKANSLIKLQTTTKYELDSFLPSILDKAFKGEL